MAKDTRLLKAFHRDLFDFFVKDAMHRSRRMRGLTRQVLAAQERLRGCVDAKAWDAYLDLERVVNERAARQLALMLRRILRVSRDNA